MVWMNITKIGCASSTDGTIYGCKYSGGTYGSQPNAQNAFQANVKTTACAGSPPSTVPNATIATGSDVDDPQIFDGQLPEGQTTAAKPRGMTANDNGANLAAAVDDDDLFAVAKLGS